MSERFSGVTRREPFQHTAWNTWPPRTPARGSAVFHALSTGPASGSVSPLMDRRAFLSTVIGSLLAAPLAAAAQPAEKVYRVGVLSPGNPGPGIAAFGLGCRKP